jgi:hypothetical protein
MIEWTRNRIRAKVSRQQPYPEPCLLVVNAHPDKMLDLRDWANVAEGATAELAGGSFAGCFIVEWGSNTVVWALARPTQRDMAVLQG